MKTTLFSLVAIIGSITLFSCKKANQQSTVAYQVKTTSKASPLARMQSGSITWTSGFASSKEIEFEAENSNGHVQFKSEALQKIDLFSPVSSLGIVTLTPGVYSQVQFEVELAPTATDPAFELKGTYNNTPVIFRINSDVTVEGEQTNLTIADEKSYTSLISLNLANLTTGVTSASLDAATKDGSGTIVISASSNSSIYNVMLGNIHNVGEEDFH